MTDEIDNARTGENGKQILSICVPFEITRRGGRTRMILPETTTRSAPNTNDALVRALARAHRWQRMFETGDYATLTDLAVAEGVTQSYLTRILRLTFLAPGIVEAILEGQQPEGPSLTVLLRGVPEDWRAQPLTQSRSASGVRS